MKKTARRVFGLATALIGGFNGQALAHAELASEVPAAGAVIAVSPAEVDLAFTEGVDLAFTGIKISGPGSVSMGKPRLKSGGDTTLIVPLVGKLRSGTYAVSWHALSTDGHKSRGTYAFTIKP